MVRSFCKNEGSMQCGIITFLNEGYRVSFFFFFSWATTWLTKSKKRNGKTASAEFFADEGTSSWLDPDPTTEETACLTGLNNPFFANLRRACDFYRRLLIQYCEVRSFFFLCFRSKRAEMRTPLQAPVNGILSSPKLRLLHFWITVLSTQENDVYPRLLIQYGELFFFLFVFESC